MTPFLLAAAVLTAAVLAIMVLPLLRRSGGRGIDRAAVNAKLLRDEMAALERERPKLADDEYQRSRDELTRRVLEDASPVVQQMRSGSAAPTIVALALIVPICGALLYELLGTPSALGGAATAASVAAQAGTAAPPPEVRKMVDSLAAKLAAHPDDPNGWAMLGRSYSVIGEFDKAAQAYGRIGPQLQRHASWLAEYADALAMSANGSPLGKPERLARQALALDPNNVLALMLAGYATAQRGDDAGALPMLEHASRLVEAGSEDAAFLSNVIDQVRRRMGLSSAADAAMAPAAGASAAVTRIAAAGGGSRQAGSAAPALLHVQVRVAPQFSAAAGGRTLYLIARVPGQRMPVAALRETGVSLPADLSLSDANSMDSQHPLSSIAGPLQVEARLSASGDAMPASGDFFGAAQVERGGSVSLTIDQRRP